MAQKLLMPKATAVWLVENTALSFEQIAQFCDLHLLEIKAIADGESTQGIKGLDPIHNGQITRDEITKGENNPEYKLKISEPKVRLPEPKHKKQKYTPLSKRHDRPNAILWFIRNHPNLKDSQISQLIGTTKNTIEHIRQRTHWNSANLVPIDPVTLGLCTQTDLNREVEKAEKNNPQILPKNISTTENQETLLPTSFTENLEIAVEEHQKNSAEKKKDLEAENIFSKLSPFKKDNHLEK